MRIAETIEVEGVGIGRDEYVSAGNIRVSILNLRYEKEGHPMWVLFALATFSDPSYIQCRKHSRCLF